MKRRAQTYYLAAACLAAPAFLAPAVARPSARRLETRTEARASRAEARPAERFQAAYGPAPGAAPASPAGPHPWGWEPSHRHATRPGAALASFAPGPLPLALAIAISLPLAAGAILARAGRPRRSAVCPVCGSRHGARVGQVGIHRNGYRCHTCGFLWEPAARTAVSA